jgi:hypothetical protein
LAKLNRTPEAIAALQEGLRQEPANATVQAKLNELMGAA